MNSKTMPRPAKKFPTRRLNLEMSNSVRKKLEKLQQQTEADSLAEVIRRSLAVYDFLWSEKRKGGKLVIKSSDGDKEVVII